MSDRIWIKNLKSDIDQIELFIVEMKNYVKHLSKNDFEPIRVHNSIISQFTDSLEAVVILLNSNYKDSSTLLTSKINNINGIFIYLRKMIEANMILNIAINNGKELYKLYLSQDSNDESHVSNKFGNNKNMFAFSNEPSKKKYYWIEKALDVRVDSIDDLIDLAHVVPDAKSNMKAWIKECNYMSHPTLYSDDKIIAPFNGTFMDDIYYVFEIMIEIIHAFYEMIKAIENVPQYNSEYDIDEIKARIPILSLFKKDFFTKLSNNFTFESNFKQVDYNQVPYNIRTEFSMVNLGITAPFVENGLGGRKKRTLGKLIDIFAEDLRDLLIGYYQKNNAIFYSKIRQVLEDASYINQMLNMTEDQIEIFQAYTDIQRYINADYVINIRKNYIRPPFDFKKWDISSSNKKMTVEQYYQQNLTFLKDYYKNKFSQNVKTKDIKRPNSWLYDGKNIPSNWQMIKTMLLNINHHTHENIDFYSGLYSLSSLHCHINNFSITNKYIQKEQTYIYYLKSVMVVVKTIYDTLMAFAPNDFKSIFKQNQTALNKLMYDLYNYDIINVPNPN